MSNRFASLKSHVTLVSGPRPPVKKALKKIREIQALLMRDGGLTDEEIEKIKKLSFWESILKIVEPAPDRDAQEALNKKQQLRHEEKQRQKAAIAEAARLKEERKTELRTKTEAAKEKYKNEKSTKAKTQAQYEEELRDYARQREEQERKQQEDYKRFEGINVKEIRKHEEKLTNCTKYRLMYEEFTSLHKQNKSINKTFRKLSSKYHPDKNFGKEEWAIVIQQHLENIRTYLQDIMHYA
jgi:hypothetical protein